MSMERDFQKRFSEKIYVSFAEYSLLYRTLLQKRPIILRSLLQALQRVHVGGICMLVV